ncbi:SDR family oxidoreductase [Streptomyces umbrinus]|uniref:SDR family oxidoreductase n=1 Tax=Streptomyces umbrinus TaxID=67370 RepID=UPI0033DD14EA
MSRFDGRRFLITGAGGGLGYAYAERLGREGAAVVIAELDEARGAAAADKLVGEGIDAIFLPADVTSEESMAALAARVAEGAPLDGFVANAGWANGVGGKRYDEWSAETWDRMMAINVKGVWQTVKFLAPSMKDGGAIVTLSSDCIFWGAPLLLHYMTSKSAVVGMTRSLARELGEREIRVNAVAPGLTKIEATQTVAAQRWRDYADRKIIKRDQYPDDLTGVIAFLLSDDSRFVTGQLLAVDGGFALH